MAVITKDDRDAWYHSPVTQAFLQSLADCRQETMEAWANEEYAGESPEVTLQKNAKALGGIDLLNKVVSLVEDHKDIEEKKHD